MKTEDLKARVKDIMEEHPYNIEFKQDDVWTDVTITTDIIGYYSLTQLKEIFMDYPVIDAVENKIALHFMIRL